MKALVTKMPCKKGLGIDESKAVDYFFLRILVVISESKDKFDLTCRMSEIDHEYLGFKLNDLYTFLFRSDVVYIHLSKSFNNNIIVNYEDRSAGSD